jgi:hypothetical protein
VTDQVEIPQTQPGWDDLATVVERQWPGVPFDAAPLDGGMTNRNWKVTVGTHEPQSYAVQLLLSDADAEHIGINRDTHAKAITIADDLGIGPKLIAWQRDSPKAIISEYVECTPPHSGPDRIRTAQLTAEALSLLHAGTTGADLPGWISDPFSGVEWLYDKASRFAPELAARFRSAVDINRRCQQARGTYASCLLHADVSVGNVLTDGSRAYLIDWEYAGLGDKYYDCGDFVEKWNLNAQEESAFVERYRQAESYEFAEAVIFMYRFTARLREGLWAASISVVNFIDFDHVQYANVCLDRLAEIVDDPRFEESVRIVDAERKIQ